MFTLTIGKVPIQRMRKPEGASIFDPETRDQVSFYDEMVPGYSMAVYFPDEKLFTGRRGAGAPLTDEQIDKQAARLAASVARFMKKRRDYVVDRKEE